MPARRATIYMLVYYILAFSMLTRYNVFTRVDRAVEITEAEKLVVAVYSTTSDLWSRDGVKIGAS